MATSEGKAGPVLTGDAAQGVMRLDRLGSSVVTDGMGHFQELVSRGLVFTAVLYGTGTPTAGQIHTAGAAPAAAATTQFAVFNPIGSGKLLSLLRVAIATISGTATAGAVMHGIFTTGVVPTTAQTNGSVKNNLINGPGSVAAATTQMVAAGAALTGGGAPLIHSVSNLALPAFAPTLFGNQSAVENLDGLIVIPPGMGWVPLIAGVGTSHLVAYSATWAETPI